MLLLFCRLPSLVYFTSVHCRICLLCLSLCLLFVSLVLVQDECALTFSGDSSSIGKAYAVALRIEDYSPGSSVQGPLSGVDLQFTLEILNVSSSCDAKPVFTVATPAGGICTPVVLGSEYNAKVEVKHVDPSQAWVYPRDRAEGGAGESLAPPHSWGAWSIPLIFFTNIPIAEDEAFTKTFVIFKIYNASPAIQRIKWTTLHPPPPPGYEGLQVRVQPFHLKTRFTVLVIISFQRSSHYRDHHHHHRWSTT